MKIIFFGSTDFSLPILEKISEEFEILAVVIVKPKPKGRGLRISRPKVAEWADSKGIRIFDPDEPNTATFIETISTLKPDLFVLAAYGHILSAELLRVPKFGGINVHPSLLPKYRGAAPIQRAIMAGEKKTGITIFFMDEQIDHGEIIVQKEVAIDPYETYGILSNRLSTLATKIINDVLRSVEKGTYTLYKQNEEEKSSAPKIKKEEMFINWCDSTEKIFNLIRALSPTPGARTSFRGKELIITQALPSTKKIGPGYFHVEHTNLYIGTSDSSVMVLEIKPENRAKMTGRDFVNGFRIKGGEKIDECT